VSPLVAVDMKTSNLASMMNAFHHVGANVQVTDDPATVAAAKVILLPGVGAFERAMNSLSQQGLVDVLRRKALQERTPFFGICLGMQLMAQESEEHGLHKGLGLLDARVVKLAPSDPSCRVPNIGWCDVRRARGDTLFPAGEADSSFYFVHSYHMQCRAEECVAATIEFSGDDIVVAVEQGHLFGCQFHPEKSQDAGLDLIHRFVRRMHADGRLS
jgi:imidazole glycerol-phosphate synthase subunit HisH